MTFINDSDGYNGCQSQFDGMFFRKKIVYKIVLLHFLNLNHNVYQITH